MGCRDTQVTKSVGAGAGVYPVVSEVRGVNNSSLVSGHDWLEIPLPTIEDSGKRMCLWEENNVALDMLSSARSWI